MRLRENNGLRRLVAFAIDWVVIAAWGGLIFGLVMLFSNGDPQAFPNPWVSQGVGIFSMTLLVTLYFAVLESSRFRASFGKVVVGLRVGTSHGESLTLRRSLLRTVFKFLPWELGHLVAQQAIFSGISGVPVWVYLPMCLSLGLPLWWVGSLLLKGEAPYDDWVGARVEKSSV